jgi:Transposase, Mutator family
MRSSRWIGYAALRHWVPYVVGCRACINVDRFRRRRFPGFDEKIVSMYARGMTVREIQGHLLDLYGLEVWPDLVSTITDAALFESAHVMMVRSAKWSVLKASAMKIAKRRGLKRANVALARKPAVVLSIAFGLTEPTSAFRRRRRSPRGPPYNEGERDQTIPLSTEYERR